MELTEYSGDSWILRGLLDERVYVSLKVQREGNLFALYYEGERDRYAVLLCSAADDYQMHIRTSGQWSRFAPQWLPFFRRGVWLSGFNIEATAHEKAEWMQGFSREELEAWNLKI